MVLTVIPLHQLVVLADEREEAVLTCAGLMFASLFYLREKPRARYYGVSLEQFLTGRGAHLAGDDALQIRLHRQFVYGADLIRVDHKAQRSEEGLRLLSFPMEVDADGDVVQRERSVLLLRNERQLAILRTVPKDGSFAELHHLFAVNKISLCHIRAVKREGYPCSTYDAYGYVGLLSCEMVIGRSLSCRNGAQLVGYLIVVCLGNATLLYDADSLFGCNLFEVGLTWSNDEARHIERSRAYQTLLLAFGKVTVRAMLATRDYHHLIVAAVAPCHDIHHRLRVAAVHRQCGIEHTEELFACCLV